VTDDRRQPQPEGEPYAGGAGGRSEDGRATYGGSNPGQDPFTTAGEAAVRHDEEVRVRSSGAGEPIPAGGRDGVEQPPASVVGQRLRQIEDDVLHGHIEDAPHDGFTGEANEAEARYRAGLPPTDD